MHIITDAAAMADALASSLDPAVKRLLAQRRDQLLADTDGNYDLGELAHWIVVAPGDPFAAIEAAAGFPLDEHPWEWVLDHHGVFEAPIIVSDCGFGIVLIVPDSEGVDPTLISLLRADADEQRHRG